MVRTLLLLCAFISYAPATASSAASETQFDESNDSSNGAAILQVGSAVSVKGAKINMTSTCVSRNTASNSAGGYEGRNYYLDRHNVQCNYDEALHKWQVITRRRRRRDAWSRRRTWAVNVEVECCKDPGLSTSIRHAYTGLSDDGNGNVVYMDRHNAECNSQEVMRKWKVSRNSGHTKIRIDYDCATSLYALTCTDRATIASGDGSRDWGGMIYMDRHDVNCPYGQYLQRWQLKRDGRRRQSLIKVNYRCCSLQLPEPTTTPPPTAPPTYAPTTTPPPDDAATTTPEIFTTPGPQCHECRLDFSNLVTNPLGSSSVFKKYDTAQVLKFENVCTVNGNNLNLNMEIQPGYEGKTINNKAQNKMYILNLKLGTSASVKFTLVDQAGVPQQVEKVLMSILDLDSGNNNEKQSIVAQGFTEYHKGNDVTEVTENGAIKFTASKFGNADDNPTDPLQLPPAALNSAVSLLYSSTSEWTLDMEIAGSTNTGRNFYFAGSTQLFLSSCQSVSTLQTE